MDERAEGTARRRLRTDRGYALISVLLTTAVLLPLGAFAVMQARLDALVAQRTRLAATTLAVAESGLEHALADLSHDPRFDRLPAGDGGEFPFRDAPPEAFPAPPFRYQVRVVAAGADGAEIVAHGRGPFGAVRAVAASVRRGSVPHLAGALVAEAPALALRLGDGWQVDGAAADTTHADVPALAARDAAGVRAALPNTAAARLRGPGGAPSIGGEVSPVVAALLAGARSRHDAVPLDGVAGGALGDGLFVAAGALRLRDARGGGILVVDGSLTLSGRVDFTGLIVASGDLRAEAGAGVAIDGGLLLGPGATLVDLAGSGALRYDARVLSRLAAAYPDLLPLPARVTGWRELADASP